MQAKKPLTLTLTNHNSPPLGCTRFDLGSLSRFCSCFCCLLYRYSLYFFINLRLPLRQRCAMYLRKNPAKFTFASYLSSNRRLNLWPNKGPAKCHSRFDRVRVFDRGVRHKFQRLAFPTQTMKIQLRDQSQGIKFG